jgi:Sterol desaturase
VAGITDRPLISFLIYLIVLDFAGYWYHRAQHQIQWWWELHAVHHSQRQAQPLVGRPQPCAR